MECAIAIFNVDPVSTVVHTLNSMLPRMADGGRLQFTVCWHGNRIGRFVSTIGALVFLTPSPWPLARHRVIARFGNTPKHAGREVQSPEVV